MCVEVESDGDCPFSLSGALTGQFEQRPGTPPCRPCTWMLLPCGADCTFMAAENTHPCAAVSTQWSADGGRRSAHGGQQTAVSRRRSALTCLIPDPADIQSAPPADSAALVLAVGVTETTLDNYANIPIGRSD